MPSINWTQWCYFRAMDGPRRGASLTAEGANNANLSLWKTKLGKRLFVCLLRTPLYSAVGASPGYVAAPPQLGDSRPQLYALAAPTDAQGAARPLALGGIAAN